MMTIDEWWTGRSARTRLAVGAVAAAAWLAGGWLLTRMVGPDPPRLAIRTSGDTALAAEVERLLGDDRAGLDALAVAVIDGDGIRTTGFGRDSDGRPVGPDTAFEIGSVGKGLTGMLLAEMIEAGEVAPGDTLGSLDADIDDLPGSGDDASLEALASHRAGYPRLPLISLPRVILSRYTGGDPYTGDAADVLAAGVATDASSGRHAYSNLGVATLGDGLAARAGQPYAELLAGRILEPLDMTDTRVLGPGSELPASRTSGREAGSGRTVAPWLATGWQPAGIGSWSTSADLIRLLTDLMRGTAPGASAVEPRFTVSDDRSIGYGWFTDTVDSADGSPDGSGTTEVTWHNGGTSGFSSWVGYDPATGRGAVVLSNTTRPVDELGLRLVLGRSDPLPGAGTGPFPWLVGVLAVAGLVPGLVSVARAVFGQRGDRRRLVDAGVTAVTLLALTRILGSWHVVPRIFWAGGAALALAILAGAVVAWPHLPTTSGGRARLRWATTVFGAVVGALLVAVAW